MIDFVLIYRTYIAYFPKPEQLIFALMEQIAAEHSPIYIAQVDFMTPIKTAKIQLKDGIWIRNGSTIAEITDLKEKIDE